MQIHRVGGRDLRDALEKARTTHGDEAVVLSHESTPGGGVTVSVTQGTNRLVASGSNERENAAVLEPGRRDVLERLHAAGASDVLVSAVLAEIETSGTQGAFAIDTAAVAIARRMRVASSPRPPRGPGRARVIAFVGPTGSGKTATVAKLADRLTRAGRAVAVATLDSYRPGGVHVLAAEAERVGVPYRPCRYREDVAGFVAEQSGCDAILLDTRGRSPQDTEHVSQLASALTESLESADLVTYLVVAATASKASLQEVLAGFARTRPEAAVVTKVDETRRTAVALEVVQGRGLPIAFLCTGQEIATDFYRATPDRMADLVLGGRVR